MYSQLPDYGELQGYDLGVESALCQIAQKVYPSYRNPSWETLKRHLFTVGVPKKFFRVLRNIDDPVKREISRKTGCLEGWVKSLLITHAVDW